MNPVQFWMALTQTLCFTGGCSTWLHVPDTHVDGSTGVKVHTAWCCRAGLAISFQAEPPFPLLQCDRPATAEEGKNRKWQSKWRKKSSVTVLVFFFNPSILFFPHFTSRPLCFSPIGPPAAILSGITSQNRFLWKTFHFASTLCCKTCVQKLLRYADNLLFYTLWKDHLDKYCWKDFWMQTSADRSMKNQLTLKCVDDSAGDVVQNGDEVVQRCKSSSSADQTCLNCVSVPLAFQLRTSVSLYRELGSRSLWRSACCVWRRLRWASTSQSWSWKLWPPSPALLAFCPSETG